MEFVAGVLIAAATTAVSSAVSKLGRVIKSGLLDNKTKADATYIKRELLFIEGTIKGNSSVGRWANPPQSVWIAELRRLAYDIEDCLDCFQVKRTTDKEFAEEVDLLKTRSKETHEQLLAYMEIDRGLRQLASISSSTQEGQGEEQSAPAAAASDEVPPVPPELQAFLRTSQSRDWSDSLNCLLYFCMFPHEHHARRNPLIRRWIAEGLVQGEGAAVKYLESLVDGRIIDTIARSSNGTMKRCRPPDEILEFIKRQSISTDFMLFCDDMDNLQAEGTRRLSLHPSEVSKPGDMNLPDLSHLHTLAVFCGGANPGCCEAISKHGNKYEIKYEVLRVLDLKECAPLYRRHLSAICKLLLLKYLSIRIQSGTDHCLPREIGKLNWLETLDLRGSETVTVYKEVLMMPNLKHLLGKFQLSKWESLNNRRILKWKNAGLLDFLEKKSVLETLSGFVTDGRLGFPQLMSLMRKLKKVKIWCKSNASKENLDDISRAIEKFIRGGVQEPGRRRSLSIDFQGPLLNDILQVEGTPTSPQEGIQKEYIHTLGSLKLHGKLSGFPQFVAQLSCIEELCLSSTALMSWDKILAGLSNLEILKYLKLVEDKLEHVKILPEHLRSLERICLVCVEHLDIEIHAGALPKLVSLHIICKALRVLPGTPDMGITHMGRLQEVGLHPQVDQEIKQACEDAAEAHPNNKLRVLFVEATNVGGQRRSSANP
ncbi:hypothetical protein U9M48_011753 [Paspalum notatum var. saurae]|uniref:Rx N-terminal domain-containing protein n=1 Tax=Paspalum notatum var. saurae TaxID=547442 RepID=A0AAQ3WHU3_PASNO